MADRFELAKAVSPYRNSSQHPLRIVFQMYEGDTPITKQFYMDVVYNGGLEGSYKSPNGERIALEFLMVDSLIYEYGDTSNVLDTLSTITFSPVNRSGAVISNSSTGEWTVLDNVYNILNTSFIYDGLIASNGSLITGGNATVNGVTFTGLAEFTGNEWLSRAYFGSLFNAIYTIAPGANNKLYIGGIFSSITDSVGNTITNVAPATELSIVAYDTVTKAISYIGSVYTNGVGSGTVDKIIVATYNGEEVLYIGGNFDRIQQSDLTVVTAINLARYTVSTGQWDDINGVGNTAFGTATPGRVYALMLDTSGVLWVGGDFLGNTASTDYTLSDTYRNILRYNTISDTLLATDQLVTGGSGLGSTNTTTINVALTGRVRSIVQMTNGQVIAGGLFDSTGAMETYSSVYSATRPNSLLQIPVGMAIWTGTQWISIGNNAVMSHKNGVAQVGEVMDVRSGSTGEILVSGQFDYFGPLYFNGYDKDETQWGGQYALANYPSNATGFGYIRHINATPISFIDDNNHNTVGQFIVQGGLYGDNNYQEIASSTAGSALLSFPPGYSGSVFYGGEYTGTIYTVVPSVVTLTGTADVKPVINITGPATLHSIENASTYSGIYFKNGLQLLVGETLIIDLTGLRPNIYTTRRGSVFNEVSLSSALTSFRLVNGDNILRTNYLAIPAISNAAYDFPVVRISYRKTYASIDAATGAI